MFNTIIWAMVSAVLVLVTVMIVGMTGKMEMAFVGGAAVIVGSVVSWMRDKSDEIAYSIENEVLILKRAGQEERIAIADVQDASLLDRVAARDYIQQGMRIAKEGGVDQPTIDAMRFDFTRYCSIDIGLRSYSFGIGRDMTDRMRIAKHDLVIVRLRGGRTLLLTPVYTQDLVDSIGRIIQRLPRREKQA